MFPRTLGAKETLGETRPALVGLRRNGDRARLGLRAVLPRIDCEYDCDVLRLVLLFFETKEKALPYILFPLELLVSS